jgi:histone-lysine N-methyltransferase SUV420H
VDFQVYYWTTIRKNRNMYHASRGIREEDITSILQNAVIIEKDPLKAESELLALPGLRKFSESLKSDKEKEDFRRHLRRYINIYLPDCPFEISSTNRYTVVTHEAAIIARRDIKKGETIKYLCGVQVIMTPEEEADIALQKRDFSVVISSRNKTASLFLGPARFANHDCGANARLMTSGAAGMEIIAVREIEIGDEITVTYGDNYFGEDNCECLCKTCEERQENGWERDGDNPIQVSPKPSIEEEPTSGGSYSFRRKRKYDSMDSSRTPSVTPDMRPRIPKTTPKSLARLGKQISSAPNSPALQHKTTALFKQKRELMQLLADMAPVHKKSRLSAPVKVEDISSNESTLYSTPASSRDNSIGSSRQSESPVPSSLDFTQTDATSVDDEIIPTRPKRRAAGMLGSAYKEAMDQVRSGDAIIVGPSTRKAHPVIEDAKSSSPSDIVSEMEDIRTIAAKTKEMRKLKRPSSKLLTKTLDKNSRKKRHKKRAVVPPSTTDLDHAPKLRIPGDYVLTPLLLAQPASAWIACKICDEFFVQLDAYFTRSSCPRCERHSKLFGYQWPKTDKEGKHDSEERVTDHRTVHRFIRPDEEKAIRKRAREAGATRSTTRESTGNEEEEDTPVERRSGRIRKKRERFTL